MEKMDMASAYIARTVLLDEIEPLYQAIHESIVQKTNPSKALIKNMTKFFKDKKFSSLDSKRQLEELAKKAEVKRSLS